ncbi:MAG: hypothetical protein K1X67_24725 [Fimbriimonadaceae bacterium]|nr:hypothetical protein [Fimbriimonadaceae bacterium]
MTHYGGGTLWGIVAELESPLTGQRILKLYAPLALSWIMMALESPISVGVISRLPNAEVNTAAFLVLMGLSLWIESPVIDLLTTSTTLATSPARYRALRKFALALMALSTVVHAAVALIPALYNGVTLGILGLKPEVAEAGRVAFAFMIPWSAFIGWRRFLQGILIRRHQTRLIGLGTALRVSTMAVTCLLLYRFAPWTGIQIAALGLIASVMAEAIFIHVASRPTVHEAFASHAAEPQAEALNWKRLVKFHAPLTATVLLLLSANPLTSAALARTNDAVLALASWQIAMTLIWLFRTVTFALPEVVITLYREGDAARTLYRFCLSVVLVCSGLMFLAHVTGLDQWFFVRVLDAKPELAAAAAIAILGCSLQPLIGALQSYLRGVLTAHHLTVSRLWAIGVGLGTLVAGLALAVALKLPGVVVAAGAFTVSLLAELAVLALAWRRSQRIPSLQS